MLDHDLLCTSMLRTAVSNSRCNSFFFFIVEPIRRTTFDNSSLKLKRDRERRFAIISVVTNRQMLETLV